MYDKNSLINLLVKHDFVSCNSLPAGKTGIENPGDLNLYEREEETLYVEGKKKMSSS